MKKKQNFSCFFKENQFVLNFSYLSYLCIIQIENSISIVIDFIYFQLNKD